MAVYRIRKIMDETLKKEMSYLAIFSTIKKLYESGAISKEVFNRLNTKIAECQNCKPITI